MELDPRKSRILTCVVESYIRTGEPIGSKMIAAMLERLEAMGKAVRIQEEPDGCLSGSCKHCPEGKACLREWWALRE